MTERPQIVLRSAAALSLAASLLVVPAVEAALTRGPYLQIGTPTSMVVRWRTDVAEDSRVRVGTSVGSLSITVDDATSTTEHEVTVTGLTANTTYFYEVGSTTTALAGDDADHWFKTSPTTGSQVATRIWAIGDSGYPHPGETIPGSWYRNGDDVRDEYISFNGGVGSADVWLLLGDNAYTNATDAQYQSALFEQYPTFVRTTPAWACIGNHEGFSANSVTETGPYYDVFTLPTGGEAGGVASGTESYYSFDYANIHFVVLDSEDTIESPAETQIMQDWLEADLAATDQDWLIAFWHRPPYSKGFLHDSDSEQQEIDMRVEMNPILEDYGVDFVLGGHSHHYERSVMIDGHYGLSPTFNATHTVDGGDGDPLGDGAYQKIAPGLQSHSGTVYVVAGSASEVRPNLGVHPIMSVAEEWMGSFILDIDGLTATATFVDEFGNVGDTFEMTKGTACPATPPAGCTAAAKSKLVVKDNDNDKRDTLIWRAKNMNVDPVDVGDPVSSDTTDVCLYDANGWLVANSLAPSAVYWKAVGSGFRYKDTFAEAQGVKVTKVKTSTAGKGLILYKAKGASTLMPSTPLAMPVTAVAQNRDTGACWESTFTVGDVKKNEVGKFIAVN